MKKQGYLYEEYCHGIHEKARKEERAILFRVLSCFSWLKKQGYWHEFKL